MTPETSSAQSTEPPTPTTRNFRVIEGDSTTKDANFSNSFPSPNDHVAHFPSAMYSLNSGTFPTRERTDELEETGRANRILAVLNTARREVRELVSQGVEKSGMSLSPEDKQNVVNQVLSEIRSQMWTTEIKA